MHEINIYTKIVKLKNSLLLACAYLNALPTG